MANSILWEVDARLVCAWSDAWRIGVCATVRTCAFSGHHHFLWPGVLFRRVRDSGTGRAIGPLVLCGRRFCFFFFKCPIWTLWIMVTFRSFILNEITLFGDRTTRSSDGFSSAFSSLAVRMDIRNNGILNVSRSANAFATRISLRAS